MRFWYIFHKNAAGFIIGFLGGSIAALLIIAAAAITASVFT